ncbi:MAG: cytochrome P450 [Pseudomonadota bacterium]
MTLPTVSQSPRDPAFVQDPYPAYDRMRALGPLVWWEEYGRAMAVSHALVGQLLRDRRFGREDPAPVPPPARLVPFYAVERNSMLEREPPAHTRLRSLVLRAFTSRRIAGLAPEIAALSHTLIDRFERPEIDLLPAFAERLPVIVIARLLGVPDEMADQLLAWSHAMVAMYQARRDRAVEDAAVAATEAFGAYLSDLIAERQKAPRDDLLSHLIAAEAEGERLSRDELIATVILLLNAGHEATVHALGNGVKALLEARATLVLREAPEKVAEEILRFDPPLHLFMRFAYEDVEIAGHPIRRGEQVGLLLAAAGRDPEAYADPHSFQPEREGPTHHALGAGIHFCVGAPLARLEVATALPILFDRHPDLHLASPPRYADRYHFHGLERLDVHLV